VTLTNGTTTVAANDNWAGAATVVSAGAAAGAFPFSSTTSRDAALANSSAPGAYNLLVTSADATSGQVLAEIYDTSATVTATTPRLVNLSTRTDVTAAGGPLIVGFTVAGDAALSVLVRAAGPALAAFGVTGALGDPQLVLYRGSTVVASNDNWSVAGNVTAVAAAAAQAGAFALASGSRDAALLASLPPGGYTVQVTGVANAAGNVLVEVYEVK
jgi:hypothetical protein